MMRHPSARGIVATPLLALLALCLLPTAASASMFAGEALDNVATYMAWFIVIVMPIVAIIVFWKLHILPEKIAEKRHHPQKDAIQVLCLLSLAFGGLLWPIAWLWAYTRPTTSFLAYGTEKHEDYFIDLGEEWRAGKLTNEEIEGLREQLDAMATKAPLPAKLKTLRRELIAAQTPQAPPAAPPAPAGEALSGGTA